MFPGSKLASLASSFAVLTLNASPLLLNFLMVDDLIKLSLKSLLLFLDKGLSLLKMPLLARADMAFLSACF